MIINGKYNQHFGVDRKTWRLKMNVGETGNGLNNFVRETIDHLRFRF